VLVPIESRAFVPVIVEEAILNMLPAACTVPPPTVIRPSGLNAIWFTIAPAGVLAAPRKRVEFREV
jgi:hypothetical protein